MKECSKNAWLITWEDDRGGGRSIPRSKVVSILPFRTPANVVCEVVKALFVSDYPLSLSEKWHFGLSSEQRRLCMHQSSAEHFFYGSHEQLYARKVKNLRRKTRKDGTEELLWTEFARYRIDPVTMRPVITVDERENSWNERPA